MKELNVYTDGGSRGNPGDAAIGILFYDKNKKIFEYKGKIGKATNNIAEYKALIKALDLAKDYCQEVIHCYLDSELACKQIKGDYKIKQDHLKILYEELKDKEKNYSSVDYTNLPREDERISQADKLVNEALDEK